MSITKISYFIGLFIFLAVYLSLGLSKIYSQSSRLEELEQRFQELNRERQELRDSLKRNSLNKYEKKQNLSQITNIDDEIKNILPEFGRLEKEKQMSLQAPLNRKDWVKEEFFKTVVKKESSETQNRKISFSPAVKEELHENLAKISGEYDFLKEKMKSSGNSDLIETIEKIVRKRIGNLANQKGGWPVLKDETHLLERAKKWLEEAKALERQIKRRGGFFRFLFPQKPKIPPKLLPQLGRGVGGGLNIGSVVVLPLEYQLSRATAPLEGKTVREVLQTEDFLQRIQYVLELKQTIEAGYDQDADEETKQRAAAVREELKLYGELTSDPLVNHGTISLEALKKREEKQYLDLLKQWQKELQKAVPKIEEDWLNKLRIL